MRDKEDIFKDFVTELRRKEKEESRNMKEKVKLMLLYYGKRPVDKGRFGNVDGEGMGVIKKNMCVSENKRQRKVI